MLEFDGARDPEVFLDWLRAIERKFDYKNYDERKRYKFAVHQFTERAALWYEKLKARRRREGKGKIQSWEKLKKHLKRKFLPTNYEQELYFQHTKRKSQVVHRKQEVPERLFLNTRDPPKLLRSPPLKHHEPTWNDLFTAASATIEKIMNLLKEQQEAKEAAMREQQQEDEFVCASNPTSNMATSKEAHDSPKEQQTVVESPQFARVKSPMKSQLEAIQEQHKQSVVLQDKTDLFTDLFVLPIEDKGVNEDDLVQEETETQEEPELPITSLAKEEEPNEEEGPRESAPLHLDDLNLQHLEPNLRANSFQEGEIDAGARGPKRKAKNRRQTKYKKCNLEPTNINPHEPRNNLNKLKYQDPP